nr:tRNA dihydrouridine synthase DusB [candidate division Zixibacteria bacterium]
MAPLAGISNRPFRLLARKYGAALCYTEMISADAVAMNQEKTLQMIDISKDEYPIGVQLFGSKPELLASAVRKVAEFHPDLIDLNLGCPVKKVTKKNGGAALLKNLQLSVELMVAAVENARVPVTIKMRTGWEASDDVYLEIGRQAEKIGVAAVTLHARSRAHDYSTRSDWSKIALLKRELTIPVIGNGDVVTPFDARQLLDGTGCDFVMIGRAAMKNPHVFKIINTYLEEGRILPELDPASKAAMALEHARLMVACYGQKGGALKMRKHLAWYSKGFPDGAELRRKLMQVLDLSQIENIFREYLARIDMSAPNNDALISPDSP